MAKINLSYSRQRGFTLLEIMLVIIIIAILAMIAVPRFASSAETARQKADIITGREAKSALDRYQIEMGDYPKISELKANNGEITGTDFIPVYIKKLDKTVTQQNAEEGQKGFGIAEYTSDKNATPDPQNLIMLFLTSDGSAAEVIVYDKTLTKVLWYSR